MGSTGVPLNLHKQPALFNCSGSASGNACQALQLSFSSEHPGIVQVVMSDGSVQTIQEDIDSEDVVEAGNSLRGIRPPTQLPPYRKQARRTGELFAMWVAPLCGQSRLVDRPSSQVHNSARAVRVGRADLLVCC